MAFTLLSEAFLSNTSIPMQYTCQGEDISPPLAWSNPPKETKSLALIMDDPDAPDPKAPKMTYVHWILYNLPPHVHYLVENIKKAALPKGTLEGKNDWNRRGYGGPCPPIGCHRYFFKLYALDIVLPDLHEPSKIHLEVAMQGHVLEKVELVGTYEKSK